MPLPLTVLAPAAVAGLSYLNAKTSFWYDWLLIRSVVPARVLERVRSARGRLNCFYVLEANAQSKHTAQLTFLKFEGREFTYAQAYEAVLRHGTWLREAQGVKPGDIVAMDFENSDRFFFLWFGLWSIGAKPAFINYNLTGKTLTHCIKTSTASLLLVDPNVEAMVTDEVRAEVPSVRVVVVTPQVGGEIAATKPVRSPDEDRAETLGQNLAMLIYTSGTTGMPKPAIMSWSKCIMGPAFAARWMGWKKGDVFYTSMPLYHSSAAVLGLINTLEAGKTIAIGRKFSTRNFWDEARANDATIIQYVGEMCRYLLNAPPQLDPATGENMDKQHRVRVAFGNGLRPDVWNQFKERFGVDAIGEFYAATEAPLGMFNMSRNDHALGAIGRNGWLYSAIMSFAVAVVEMDLDTDEPSRDESGRCKKAKLGQAGELLFKLPPDTRVKFQGYYGNKKATSSKILRDVFREGDAWFRTGDLVIWDKEGRVFFTDRIGDTFRWKSENVSTAEVSQMMGLHPGIREANVYGVQLPRHDGRAGCAAVVLEGSPDEVLMRSLAEHAARALPSYARPLFLRLVESVDTTGTHKHQKHQLRTEGVDPDKVDLSKVYWLSEGTYVPFTEKEWRMISDGKAKL